MAINYEEYHPKFSLISRLIRKRDGNKCTSCGADNYSWLVKTGNNWVAADESAIPQLKENGQRVLQVILATVHLDHDRTNNLFINLASQCQICHMRHDQKQHANSRKYGRNYKYSQYGLFSDTQ